MLSIFGSQCIAKLKLITLDNKNISGKFMLFEKKKNENVNIVDIFIFTDNDICRSNRED